MKKALVIIGVCLLAGYLIFAALYFEEKPKEGLCTNFDIVIKNSNEDQKIVDVKDIVNYIDTKKLNPKGKSFKDINMAALESAISSNPFVKKAEVYTTGNGTVKATITERKPVMRVVNSDGSSYYVDDEGKKMPLSRSFSVYLPIATGAIKESFAMGELYKFALFLHKNEFWNAQIEQMVVMPNGDIKLIPRVGDQEIILGKLDGYEEKLNKLMIFYQKGLNKTGWNKYSIINLKYDKQVVCTKR